MRAHTEHSAARVRSTPWVEPALEAAELVLPMPLSKQRLRSRGFNQALLLARRLAPKKTADQLLLRLRDTPAQSTLSRSERLTSLAGAFAVEPQAKRLAGARVLLVDDVMTSGATLFYAARALRQAGAAHITGLVVARTPRP